MQNLPIGIQTFEKIINQNQLYVDKTKEIYNLIRISQYAFLSRPRRFGKSLLISTLKEIFSGNKELFKGLYIYDKINWEEKYPVIHLSMSNLKDTKDLGSIYESAYLMLEVNAIENGIELKKYENPAIMFGVLISKLAKINKVVVLIDEYDKPIVDHLTQNDIAQRNRNFLRDFYSVLKDNDEHIKFCLLTGVSKFSKVSVFSGLNNLYDITLDRNFSTICGITQDELNIYFDDRLPKIASEYNTTVEELKLRIKEWYNGYSWDGVNRVYNPFSILSFFSVGQFKNFWFSTGTPTFLIDKLKYDKIQIDTIENKRVGIEIFDSGEIDNINNMSLLFQTGYLTITSVDYETGICILNYPNEEVKKSFLIYLAELFFNTPVTEIRPIHFDLRMALEKLNILDFITILKSIIAKIPYQLHVPNEAYYHSLFYLIMELTGIEMDLEVNTNKGRIDGVIEFEKVIYIIEFKYLSDNKNVEELLNTAVNQIKNKEYYAPYLKKKKPIKFLAIAVNKEIVEYKIEE